MSAVPLVAGEKLLGEVPFSSRSPFLGNQQDPLSYLMGLREIKRFFGKFARFLICGLDPK